MKIRPEFFRVSKSGTCPDLPHAESSTYVLDSRRAILGPREALN